MRCILAYLNWLFCCVYSYICDVTQPRVSFNATFKSHTVGCSVNIMLCTLRDVDEVIHMMVCEFLLNVLYERTHNVQPVCVCMPIKKSANYWRTKPQGMRRKCSLNCVVIDGECVCNVHAL